MTRRPADSTQTGRHAVVAGGTHGQTGQLELWTPEEFARPTERMDVCQYKSHRQTPAVFIQTQQAELTEQNIQF